MFLSDHSFDPGLLGNTMFKFFPSIFPKSVLHIEKAGLCFSCIAEALHGHARTPSFTALWAPRDTRKLTGGP